MKKVYIGCPITGHDMKAVRKWIVSAKKEIEVGGNVPISPLDVAPEEDMPISYYMGKDIEALLECDAIYMLCGWRKSKGCYVEFITAATYGIEIMFE